MGFRGAFEGCDARRSLEAILVRAAGEGLDGAPGHRPSCAGLAPSELLLAGGVGLEASPYPVGLEGCPPTSCPTLQRLRGRRCALRCASPGGPRGFEVGGVALVRRRDDPRASGS